MDKENLIKEIQDINNQILTLEDKAEKLRLQLIMLCPFQVGEKVIMRHQKDATDYRFGFVGGITVRNDGIYEYKIFKAKKNGEKSAHYDYVYYWETLQKI